MSRKLLMNTELEPAYDPYNIDGMLYLIRGKGIDWNTNRLTSNSNCWGTVDAVTVIPNQLYNITMNGTWAWVVTYDDNDNPVSILYQGSINNPENFNVTPDTSHIRFGCFDPDNALTYCTVKAV